MMKAIGKMNLGEMLRFAAVGVLATAIHYGVYYVLLSPSGHNIAYTVGYAVSFAVNYVLSSLFTFRVSTSVKRLFSFAVSHVLNYLIGLCLLNLAISLGIRADIAPLPVFVLVVPINFLLVRYALKRRERRDDAYVLFLVAAGMAMLLLMLSDSMTLSDDTIYRFVFSEDMSADWEPIATLSDVFRSQWVHYFTVNGRSLVHFLAQAMLVFMPAWVYQSLSALLFVVLLHQCVCWTGRRDMAFCVSSVACMLMFAVMSGVSTWLLYSLGSFNYLWVSVATMCFLLVLRRLKDTTVRPLHWIVAPLALIAGWSHEGMSLPLSVGMAVYILAQRRRIMRSAQLPFILFYMVGTMMIMLSPALWSRASEGLTLQGRAVSAMVNCVLNVRIAWLLLVFMLFLWKKRPGVLRRDISDNLHLYVAAVAALGVVMVCGVTIDRVAFFVDFLSMLLLLGLSVQVLSGKTWRWLSAASCLLLAVLSVPAYVLRKENCENWRHVVTQLERQGSDVTIGVRCPAEGDSWLTDKLRARYVNPCVVFGFFSVYQAFDSSDINTRCIARLYGKNSVTLLPEDMLRRMETDSTAYADPQTDQTGKLYAWRLGERKDVSRVTFVLAEEDVSKLLPHKRLIAYKDDIYDLDDFHYEVVDVCGRSYLVFTTPTNNIKRRIDHVEYETR